MLIDRYYECVDDLFRKVRETQRENILKAGQMMADAMCNDRNIVIHDTGHLINFEMINRSGGLVAPQMLKYYLVTETDGRIRPQMKEKSLNMEGMAELVFRCSRMIDGDLLIIGSVSGRSDQVVDLAINAKEQHHCQIIALTSLEYSSSVKSNHSSGKRLFEVADLVIDNCAPLGDGMMDVEGLEMPFAPASGLSATYIMWSVYAAATEEMLKRGKTPSVFKSSNTPGGDEYNLKMEQRYQELGY